MGVGRELFGALGGGKVLEIDNGLPRCFHAEGVAVRLSKVVGKVDKAFGVLEPMYRVVVEGAEVARAVGFDQQVDNLLLCGGVGKGTCLEQIVDYALNGRCVHAAHTPHAFGEQTVFVALQTAVHAHHHGTRVGSGLALRIELFGLGLCDARCIVVAGRCLDEVVAVLLVDAHGHDGGVEHDGEEFGAHLVNGLSH